MSKEALAMEAAKLILNSYFTYMNMKGMTEAEAKEFFDKESAKFAKNDPAKLEDVG